MEHVVRQVVETAYEAATGGASWRAVGDGLKQAVGAQTASLWIGDPAAGRINMLYAESIPEEAGRAYARHFYAMDPWVEGFGKISALTPAGAQPKVAISPELLPDTAYLKTEFYQDFARHLGLFHIVGAVYPLGADGIMPLGLHRPHGAQPFGEEERRIVQAVLPHLHHAVRIKLRLDGSGVPWPTHAAGAALATMRVAAIVVDAAMRVIDANGAAESLARKGGALRLRRAGPPPSAVHLEAAGRADMARLARLCQAVARQASLGAGLSLSPDAGAETIAPTRTALLVLPLPARLMPAPWAAPTQGSVPGYAMVLARDLEQVPKPAPSRLMEFFGLTLSEAEVASALSGGVTTEAVARSRAVEPGTIRSQVRAILAKTGAPNLRRLEQMLALLPGE